MNRFATITEEIRFRKVTYFSIRFEGDDRSLFLDFVNRHNEEPFLEPLGIIRAWLRKLGEEIGAQSHYFRHEGFRGGDASALPPPAKYIGVDCNLRLYCLRIDEQNVILFNGGEKTAARAQDCDNVFPHFREANKIAKAIYQAMKDGDIGVNERTGHFTYDQNFELEI